MQKYRIRVHGQNLLQAIDGVRKRMGFFTNVFVEAFSASDAESRAIDLLREELHDIALNSEDNPLTFSVEEIEEIESFDSFRLPRQGLILYEEE